MSPSVPRPDGRVEGRIGNYFGYWKKDMSKEQEHDSANRNENYTEVVNGYYDGATELYEFGWSQNFHFSRFRPGESFPASLARHEHYLAANMNLRPGMRVLDVGCGVGGPAREIARFSDVHIVGVNNNEFQVHRARKYAKESEVGDQLTYVKCDFMTLAEQFGENSFDAVYAIEATCHAPSFDGIYGEIMKVLKPGGVFGLYEWAMTEAWDPAIPLHKAIAHEIEVGTGVPEMKHISKSRKALINVGFQIEQEEDLAERPDSVRWFYPLEGNIMKAQSFWDILLVLGTTYIGMFITHFAMWIMELVGMLPKGTQEVVKAMRICRTGLIRGGQTKLFTPMYFVISRKPLKK